MYDYYLFGSCVHDACVLVVYMTPVCWMCTWRLCVGCVHDACVLDVYMAPVCWLCTWRLYVGCVHDACMLTVYMTPVCWLCTWRLYVDCVHDACVLVVYMTPVCWLCTWRLCVDCVHDACMLTVYMTPVCWLCSGYKARLGEQCSDDGWTFCAGSYTVCDVSGDLYHTKRCQCDVSTISVRHNQQTLCGKVTCYQGTMAIVSLTRALWPM